MDIPQTAKQQHERQHDDDDKKAKPLKYRPRHDSHRDDEKQGECSPIRIDVAKQALAIYHRFITSSLQFKQAMLGSERPHRHDDQQHNCQQHPDDKDKRCHIVTVIQNRYFIQMV